ncbi:MAG: hypothetical protein LBK68_07335 [Candidatus Margulisbacteria bacterium]|nr:hypothetical protein [Candidatus Margulisiibacteriota bacterium]
MKAMNVMKVMELFWKRKMKAAAKKVAISVLVILSLAAAMGERPKRPERLDKLDTDYVYLLGAGEPMFRIYSPARRTQKLIAPTIEIID